MKIFVLLFIPLLVLAESSSENFVLTRSVIDAGGGSSSSESFEQVSAFGQSIPIGSQTSENFSLSAGFIHPVFMVSPLSPIQELVIKENQPNIDLWWEAILGAGTYSIYRDTLSGFTPSEFNFIGSTSGSSYTDTGITATPAEQYYYIVTSSP